MQKEFLIHQFNFRNKANNLNFQILRRNDDDQAKFRSIPRSKLIFSKDALNSYTLFQVDYFMLQNKETVDMRHYNFYTRFTSHKH